MQGRAAGLRLCRFRCMLCFGLYFCFWLKAGRLLRDCCVFLFLRCSFFLPQRSLLGTASADPYAFPDACRNSEAILYPRERTCSFHCSPAREQFCFASSGNASGASDPPAKCLHTVRRRVRRALRQYMQLHGHPIRVPVRTAFPAFYIHQ